MRCPKCHYISFDNGERCRNCGYDFSLASERKPQETNLDVSIQPADAPVGPLADLELAPAARPAHQTDAASGGAAARRPITAGDLPLFSDRPRTDAPAHLSLPPVPKGPLAVRKSTPPARAGRSRLEVEEPTLDLGVMDSRERSHARASKDADVLVAPESSSSSSGTAGLAARLIAGIIDTSIMVGVHGAVIYFTLRLCGLTFDEIAALPPVPMLGFLLLLTGGYFVSFTAASGQTIGKMATGIRVVPGADTDQGHTGVPLGTAMVRAAACLVSVLPAGAGLLPALLSPEHRALHDRLADTRVVKA